MKQSAGKGNRRMAANSTITKHSYLIFGSILILSLVICIVGISLFLSGKKDTHKKDTQNSQKIVHDTSVTGDMNSKDNIPRFILPNDWQFTDNKTNIRLTLTEIESVKRVDDAFDILMKGLVNELSMSVHLKVIAIIGTEDYFVSEVVSFFVADDKRTENSFEYWKHGYLLHLQSTLISRK